MKVKWLTVVFGLSLLTLLGAPPGLAQDTSAEEGLDLRSEIEALKEGQKAIQKDLQEIKSLLSTRQAPAPSPAPAPAPAPLNIDLDIEGNPYKGNRTAKLTLIEFTDYQ